MHDYCGTTPRFSKIRNKCTQTHSIYIVCINWNLWTADTFVQIEKSIFTSYANASTQMYKPLVSYENIKESDVKILFYNGITKCFYISSTVWWNKHWCQIGQKISEYLSHSESNADIHGVCRGKKGTEKSHGKRSKLMQYLKEICTEWTVYYWTDISKKIISVFFFYKMLYLYIYVCIFV